MSSADPDAVADCVLDAFRALPPKYRPRVLADGRQEWVPLAGIVLSEGECNAEHASADRCASSGKVAANTNRADADITKQDTNQDLQSSGSRVQQQLECRGIKREELTCVALATGMKCLPRDKLSQAQGNVLHDSHAEILAIRAFQRWLLDECADIIDDDAGDKAFSKWLKRRTTDELPSDEESDQPSFEVRDGVQIHMYCSEAPCGDASMEVIAGTMEDSTPWDIAKSPTTELPLPKDMYSQIEDRSFQDLAPTVASITSEEPDSLHGRAFFSLLGIVRRKPSRPDAPISLSKSCSDKLALKQCTGLLSAVSSLLIRPTAETYLQTLVLPERAIVREGVERAFRSRIRELHNDKLHEYKFRPFDVLSTTRNFVWERQPHAVASNLCAIVVSPGHARREKREILINGVLQGRKQLDPRGASILSRRSMWQTMLSIATKLGSPSLLAVLRGHKTTYRDLKESIPLRRREEVKHHIRQKVLKGWKRNLGDEEWALSQTIGSSVMDKTE